jgi:hypothetical protein
MVGQPLKRAGLQNISIRILVVTYGDACIMKLDDFGVRLSKVDSFIVSIPCEYVRIAHAGLPVAAGRITPRE